MVDSRTEYVEDDYIRCVVADGVNKSFIKCFTDSEIDACCMAVVMSDDCSKETDRCISLEDFKAKYNLKSVMFYLSLNASAITDDSLSGALKKVAELSETIGVSVSVSAFALSDVQFSRCDKDMKTAYDINSTWFDEYNPEKKCVFNINEQSFNPEINTILNELA